MVSEDNLIGQTVASANRDHHIGQESADRLAILAAQPLGAVSMGSQKLKRQRMDLPCRRASCTGDLEPTPRQMARDRLRKDAPAGIVGTNEQIFYANQVLYIQLPNRKFAAARIWMHKRTASQSASNNPVEQIRRDHTGFTTGRSHLSGNNQPPAPTASLILRQSLEFKPAVVHLLPHPADSTNNRGTGIYRCIAEHR